MDSKIRNITITLSVVFALIAYGITVFYKNKEIIEIISLGIITSTVTLLWLGVEYFAWKLPYISKLLHAKPNINGVWKGTIYNHSDEESHEAELIVEQTWTTLNVITTTNRANSTSISATIKPTNEDAVFYDLVFNWIAQSKKAEEFKGKGAFYGTSILRIDKSNQTMEGHYFTNISPKQSMGQIIFNKN